jgi:glucose dehydrogenase
MYVTAPDGVYALVPETGELLWKHDAKPVALRGLAYWPGSGGLHPRVFAGNGPFLLALDVTTGKPAPGFGNEGRVDLKKGVLGDLKDGRYVLQSPPAVFGDIVITGCSNGEGSPSAGAYGDIRGWDARTGKLLWTFHTVPRPGEAGSETWPPMPGRTAPARTSGASSPSMRSAGLCTRRSVRRPPISMAPIAWETTCMATRWWRWMRAPARRSGTGNWCITIFWDYDLAAPPALFDIRRDGRVIPAVAEITKMGLLFVFDRVTGSRSMAWKNAPCRGRRCRGK